jgi:hypothetical protein
MTTQLQFISEKHVSSFIRHSLAVTILAAALATPALAADIPEACNSYQAAVTGGPMPPADSDTQIEYTWPIIALFKPKLFLPAHHDSAPPAWVDLGLEPLFDKLRAEMPGTAYLAPLYRSPICVAAAGPDKGKVVSFKY